MRQRCFEDPSLPGPPASLPASPFPGPPASLPASPFGRLSPSFPGDRPIVGHCLFIVAALLAASASAQSPFGAPTIIGKIVWPEHDLSKGQVLLYHDEALTDLVDKFSTGGAGGTYVAIVQPGEYYLMAMVDANGNGKLDEGDGIGFFGVTGAGGEGDRRKSVTVPAEGLVADAHIAVSATIGPDGKPVPLENVPTIETEPSGVPASAAGAVTGRDDVTVPVFVAVLDAETHAARAVVRLDPETTGFDFSVPAGGYHLMAFADVSGDRKLGPGDRFGAYGVADWGQAPVDLPPLALGDGDEIGGLEVALAGRIGRDGLVSPAQGEGTFRLDLTSMPAVLSGTVPYPGAGLKPAHVRISADPGMRQPVASVPVEAGPGTFVAHVPPGAYYLTAIVDENNDSKFGLGDSIGFYGVSDLKAGAPAPVTVSAAALLSDLQITIVGRITEGGLAPIAEDNEPEG